MHRDVEVCMGQTISGRSREHYTYTIHILCSYESTVESHDEISRLLACLSLEDNST